MVKNPCMNCPKVGCGVYHDICPDYQLYRSERLKDYEKRAKFSNYVADMHVLRDRHLKASAHFNKKP